MNNDLKDSSFTVRVGGTSFETTKKTLSKLPSFEKKFKETKSYTSALKLDADPEIFRHVLNTLRDSQYITPNEYVSNVERAFEKFGADYYEFIGRPKPSILPYVLRYKLTHDVDGTLDLPTDCVSRVLGGWIEVTGSGSVTKIDFSIMDDTGKSRLISSYDTEPHRIVHRTYSEMDLLRTRKLTRRDTKQHQTCTLYELEDLTFDVQPGMSLHVLPKFTGTSKDTVRFCLKVQ